MQPVEPTTERALNSSKSSMIATLIGSTGLTGSFLVRHLLADPAITKVISISRRPLNISNAKLTEVLIADLAACPRLNPGLAGNSISVVSARRSRQRAANRTSKKWITPRL